MLTDVSIRGAGEEVEQLHAGGLEPVGDRLEKPAGEDVAQLRVGVAQGTQPGASIASAAVATTARAEVVLGRS